MVTKDGKLQFNGDTIIHCISIAETSQVKDALESLSIDCDVYHALLELSDRQQVHNHFKNKKQTTPKLWRRLVTMDKECYQQEIGRAGKQSSRAL